MEYSSVEENLYQSVLNSPMMRYNNYRSGKYRKRRTKWISSTAYLNTYLGLGLMRGRKV